MRRLVLALAIAIAALGTVRSCVCREPAAPAARFATFNIEDFPKHARQIEGAFRELAALDADVIAVQEIGDPALFAAEARRRLGARWEFVHVDTRPIGERRPGHHIGVLFDSRRWTLLSTRAHDATRLASGRHKPTLEVRLRRGDHIVRVFVVHLKSGSDGRAIREQQLLALAEIVSRAHRSAEAIVLLGDFNATEQADRDDIASLATRAGLRWASERLACSAFWARRDGCPRSRLDHVLTSDPPRSVRAAGACATDGCDWQASCPVYAKHVSDHCPVVATF